MQWKNRRQSANVEDRRGVSAGRMALGGGGALIVVVLALLFGADPAAVLDQLQSTAPSTTPGVEQPLDPHQEELKQFVSVVLADTEDVWSQQFQQLGRQYPPPTLVLYTGQVDSACGLASAAVGPFYCPSDHDVYLDLSFLDELNTRFDSPGDFAAAYVIAHEVGHHVQTELGLMAPLDQARTRGASQERINELSVRAELQADFLAGVWAHYADRTKGVLEPGDIEEALGAANAIGDDTLQKQAQGYAVPDSFTHGTSEQRVRWFRKGYETGDLNQGDTFNAGNL